MHFTRLFLSLIAILSLAACSYLSNLDLTRTLTGGLFASPESSPEGSPHDSTGTSNTASLPASEVSSQNTLAQDMDSALVEESRDQDNKEGLNEPNVPDGSNPTSDRLNKVDSGQKQVEQEESNKLKKVNELEGPVVVPQQDRKFLKFVEFEPASLIRVLGHISEIISLSRALNSISQDRADGDGGRDFLISVDRSGAGLLWDIGRAAAYRLFELEHEVQAAVFSPNNLLLAHAAGNHIAIYSLNANRDIARLELPTTRASTLSFDPAGHSLLIGGVDGKIYRWKFLGAKLAGGEDLTLERYIGHSTVVSALAFHPFGRVFFSGDWNGGLSSWITHDSDLTSGEYDRNLTRGHIYSDKSPRLSANRPNHQAIQSMVVGSDGEFLLLGTQDGMIEYWSVRGFKKVGEVSAHSGLVYDVALSPKGDLAASVGRDGHVKAWKIQKKEEAQSGELGYELVVGQDVVLPRVRKVSFSVQSRLVVGEDSGKLLEIDLP